MAWRDTSISITGEVRDEAAFGKLVAAIVKDAPTASWSDNPLFGENDAIQYVRAIVDAGSPLIFAENERDNEEFCNIEEVCRQIGLAYLVTVSVDDEHDDPGHRDVWNPVSKKLDHFIGIDEGNDALVRAGEILELLESGQTKEAISRLKTAVAPLAGLPKVFTVAPGLLPEPAPALRS